MDRAHHTHLPESLRESAHTVIDRMKHGLEKLRSKGCSKEDMEEKDQCVIPFGDDVENLHNPRDPSTFRDFLKVKGHCLDVNAIDVGQQAAPIHSIIRAQRPDKSEILFSFLVHTSAAVDLPDLEGMTPLHLVVQANDIQCTRILIVFGANMNALNWDGKTPLDLACAAAQKLFVKKLVVHQQSWLEVTMDQDTVDDDGFTLVDYSCSGKVTTEPADTELQSSPSYEQGVTSSTESQNKEVTKNQRQIYGNQVIESEMMQLLRLSGGMYGQEIREKLNVHEPTAEVDYSKPDLDWLATPTVGKFITYEDGASSRRLYNDLDDKLKQQLEVRQSIRNVDALMASTMQQRELVKYRVTGGARILCLDGGGMKGLMEIDVLEQIEGATGKKITDLFDWIVGTSTGGIIALGLVYAKKSLKDLRRVYYQIKEQVFANPKFGVAYNTEALEKLLIESLGEEMQMSDVKHPKVLIAAVHKESTPLQLHFFNNCFDDGLCNEAVWKVARCTSAGPMLFAECNNYVDGGVLANNPTEQALTAIQNFHWEKGERLPVSVVVSVGSGVYPTEKLGSVDAQDYFGFGPHWLRVSGLKNRMSNLMQLFMNALVESEMVARSCEQNFKEQGIPFFRFSPLLKHAISAGETDDRKLIDMVLTCRFDAFQRIQELATILMERVH